MTIKRMITLAVVIAAAGTLSAVFAQPGGGGPSVDMARAKQIAGLIAQGQLGLRDATSLSERYVKGTALGVACDVQPSQPIPNQRAAVEQPGTKTPSPAVARDLVKPRLIYEVTCFSKDKLYDVQVDGLTKRVIIATERK